MEWDLGLEGLAVLGAISLGFGAIAALLVGGGLAHRVRGIVITTVACFGVGLLISEWLFGWATEEELQPNIDGLSRDEVVLSSMLTTVACFGVGLLISEWLFGWATEEELQPNIDGLSRDEVVLSSMLTTALVVLSMRHVARRRQPPPPGDGGAAER